MTQLKTDERLLARLRAASKKQLTAEELRKQRVSFIMGSLNNDSDVTRAKVTEILAAHETGRGAH